MSRFSLLLAGLFFCGLAPANDQIESVKAFVDAYNKRDVEAMLATCHQDVRWMSISDNQLATETSGKPALREAMENYFNSRPAGQSETSETRSHGRFVSTVERAFQEQNGTLKSQCSLAVYEFSEKLIKNVWYYPAYTCR